MRSPNPFTDFAFLFIMLTLGHLLQGVVFLDPPNLKAWKMACPVSKAFGSVSSPGRSLEHAEEKTLWLIGRAKW